MTSDFGTFPARDDALITVDLHDAGEPLRLLLTREPRVHRDMFAAAATEPDSLADETRKRIQAVVDRAVNRC
ncbi:MAG: hypothetical protein ACQET7_04770 [Thermodesulfobacteriota bacterium]